MDEVLDYSTFNGTKLEYQNGTGQSATWVQIKGLISVPDIGGEPNKVDTTTLDNLKYQTQKNGLMPAQSYAFEFNLEDPSVTANIKLASDLEDSGEVYSWKLTYSNGIVVTFDSDVRTDIKGGGSDELIKFGMYLSPIGEPVRTIPTQTTGNGN